MTSGQAKRIVIGGCAAAGAISAARDLSAGHPPALRIFVGAMAAGMILSMLAEAAPELAAMFALTLASTAVFTAGADTWKHIGGLFT